MAVGDTARIPRVTRDKHEGPRGYLARKTRYFDGLKLPLMVTKAGQAVEWVLTPGASRDGRALHTVRCDGPAGSPVEAAQADHADAREAV
jgi:hypothetical protein